MNLVPIVKCILCCFRLRQARTLTKHVVYSLRVLYPIMGTATAGRRAGSHS
jgi:hypothetical protein